MNRFAAAHPEDWEERLEDMRAAGDRLRKERREGDLRSPLRRQPEDEPLDDEEEERRDDPPR